MGVCVIVCLPRCQLHYTPCNPMQGLSGREWVDGLSSYHTNRILTYRLFVVSR